MFSALVAWFGLPKVGQEMIEEEDERFKLYLQEQGYDISTLGTKAHKLEQEAGSAMYA